MRAVKDYPKPLRKRIKKNVLIQNNKWSIVKNGDLSTAFFWADTPEGHTFWDKINDMFNGF